MGNLLNSKRLSVATSVTFAATYVVTTVGMAQNDVAHLDNRAQRRVAHRWQREPSPNCSTSKNAVRLASSDVAEAAGFAFAEINATPLNRVLERNVELSYNANRYVRLSSRVPGVIADVLKDLGQHVRKDDVLAVVESGETGAAKAVFLQAIETAKLWRTNATQERSLVEKGIGVERQALEAETKAAESRIELNKARQHLRNLGLSTDQLRALEENGEATSSFLEVRAPFAGIVVERTAVLGEFVEAGRSLLAIADTTTMWALVDLLESDLSSVRVGQKASVHLDGLPGKTFSGTLTWISTEISETRTVAARIELDNPDGDLRAHMFGKATIVTGDGRRTLAVPKEAVQWEGCCNVVFVKADDKGLLFRPARLTLGFDTGDRYGVVDGLTSGETIVTKGSFILKNEILKSSIGAGCCEVGHLDK